MKRGKPTLEDILEQDKVLEDSIYGDLLRKFEDDEKFYELDFADLLDIPTQFKHEGVVLPTARDMVDAFVDHIDVSNARVQVNKKSAYKVSNEEAEMMRKFYLGLIHRTNVEAPISPWRVGAKHYALHGLAVFKTVWDADRWPDKPLRGDDSEEEYAEKIETWRSETHESLPIVIQAINPYNVRPDPFYGGGLFVIEKHKLTAFDAFKRWPHWGNVNGVAMGSEVEHISYWDNTYRCELVDGQPVLKIKGGVAKHNYGFIPYVFIESGLGNLSREAKPAMRYVGMLRYMLDLLVAESRDFSVADVILKREAWKGGYLTGKGAKLVKKLEQGYGLYPALPDDVEVHHWETNLPPEMLNYHLGRTADYIAAHAAPRSVRGLSESGVRSGADRRLIIAEASARYQYSKDAFKNGGAKVLTNCARLFKNVLPGDVRVWARTPTDEFDEVIKKEKMKEPFTCYLEFAPLSEEDEYRRQDSLIKLVGGGLVTRGWARKQMSNIDPIDMEFEEEKEKLKNSPQLQQLTDQYAAAKLGEGLTQLNVPPAAPQSPTGPPTGAPQPPGRSMVPPIPERAPLGSAQDLENQIKARRGTNPIGQQGQGGGGNR